ncbi:hypothetical protein [Mycobacterium malmoense]|uniref:hypothetical protein n=1 Tax=Mycobacterium malmoense TaxID=1780 RepID=UPI00159EDC3E|nr:hypothetical protein [Mycobacterium malmoense]
MALILIAALNASLCVTDLALYEHSRSVWQLVMAAVFAILGVYWLAKAVHK